MTRIFKKITALAMAAVTAGALGMGAAAEAVETAPESALPEVYCPVNDDPEFPFNIELDIAENSVNYIDLDEPVYGIERILDGEALDFGMNVSLKDEFKNFESYTFELFTADYSDKLFSQSTGSGETITVPDMSTATGYKINASMNSETLTAYYCGQFSIQVELDSTVVVDLFYQFAGMEGDMATHEDYLDENDSQNNALNQYDTLPLETVMKATINDQDSDYFAIKTSSDPSGNNTGVANLSFIFKLNPKAEINLRFFSNADYSIGTFKTTDKTSLFMLKFGNLKKNTTYKFSVKTSSTQTVAYEIIATCGFSSAWFSQYAAKDGSSVNWNTEKLDTIEQYAANENKYYPVFLEKATPTTANDDVYATACGVVSSAIIFRNLGATLTGYDYRTGQSGELQADPFTALLSNCGYNGYELLSMTKSPKNPDRYLWPNKSSIYDDYPDKLNRYIIGNKFGLSYKDIGTDDTSLREALSENGSVLVRFNDGERGVEHFMVLTGLGTGSTFIEKAIVVDPAATSYSMGAGSNGQGIKLTQTGWYKSNFANGSHVFRFSYAATFG